ncbi:MAG: site-specific DNA-methyltransferase [Ignavibacteria bacterium]|nr:site-specific DNA-methyltransferase [Ignavibacteria bacterium]
MKIVKLDKKIKKKIEKPLTTLNRIFKTTKKVKPYYKRDFGYAFLGDSLELMKSIKDNSVNLVITSPPFALTNPKEYGNEPEHKYIAWFLDFAKEFYRILTKDGSFVVDLGGTYLPGHPIRSIYQYELLIKMVRELNFFLAQEFFHYNPARLPAPAEWVNVRRIRVKDSVNVVWWLSKSEYPKADNKRVLKPYSKAMVQLLKKGYRVKDRPSGHQITHKFNKTYEGSIPPNILELGNNDSNSMYMKKCLELGIKPHPAKFPWRFADFFVKFLTDENDIVIDPFAGSNTTGFVAEQLKRRWIAYEINEEYLKGSACRFLKEEKFNEKIDNLSLNLFEA